MAIKWQAQFKRIDKVKLLISTWTACNCRLSGGVTNQGVHVCLARPPALQCRRPPGARRALQAAAPGGRGAPAGREHPALLRRGRARRGGPRARRRRHAARPGAPAAGAAPGPSAIPYPSPTAPACARRRQPRVRAPAARRGRRPAAWGGVSPVTRGPGHRVTGTREAPRATGARSVLRPPNCILVLCDALCVRRDRRVNAYPVGKCATPCTTGGAVP